MLYVKLCVIGVKNIIVNNIYWGFVFKWWFVFFLFRRFRGNNVYKVVLILVLIFGINEKII